MSNQVTFTLNLPSIQIFVIFYAVLIISLHIYLLTDINRYVGSSRGTLYVEITIFLLSILLFIGAVIWFISYRKKSIADKRNSEEANVQNVWVISDAVPNTMTSRRENAASPVPIFRPEGANMPNSNNNTNTVDTLNQTNTTYLPFMEHEVDSEGISRVKIKGKTQEK
ncbi:hypothetical protein CONCODRAFT_73641 [Conidiobolus coronatus NRRL 28638]|uniref:Uncharacterized protein n=1 Tax=Conidiobolus coronatus (strain ATCC 28846 / CBS 209.66 / NRRL 28638) TaxID=796925 RepID=A0A137NV11_CONC2|nr:hypothetical protein CONCODRAFT_73641 [Conidiobolus coronatus NRRL 28638]|eukprot:KXN66501.1 hypothetical protein CONCODRAFT_73641 [Conidiobolus coronatus NRRL 28638]